MSTIVYLSNQQVQVVTGSPGKTKLRIEQSCAAEAPEGSIINGIIMDADAFVEFMKEFWAANKLPVKDVILVINSSKFVGKIIEMPVMKMKKAYEFIEREFADMNRRENCLFSYQPLGPGTGKMIRVYVESVEPDFIREYLEIFHAAGIQVKSILSGESSLIGMTAMTIGRVHKNFSVIIADSNILTTVLWIDGSFYYFNSTRSFYEPETEEYAGDVARSVSRLTQFMQANQIEQRMECIVLAGIQKENLPLYQQSIEQMGILTRVELFEASTLSAAGGVNIQKCIRPASGLASTDKYLNFLYLYSIMAKKKAEKEEQLGLDLKPAIISLAVILVLLSAALTVMLVKKSTLNQLNNYNESPEVLSKVAAYDMMLGKNTYLNAQYDAISDIDENIHTYPVGDSSIRKRIEDCAAGYAEVTFHSFDAAGGTIEMRASSGTVDDINRFIGRLLEQDIFNQVDYTGYAFNDATLNWDIHVTCTLAEAAGR